MQPACLPACQRRASSSSSLSMPRAAAQGVDFRGVTTVVNFDFPPDATTYTHRVGRTARGGASGVALSFVAPEGVAPAQDALLGALLAPPPAAAAAAVAGVTAAAAAADAPRLPGQGLVPLPFDAREVEGFRYRVDDVIRSVNPAAVRAARLAEVRSRGAPDQAHHRSDPFPVPDLVGAP